MPNKMGGQAGDWGKRWQDTFGGFGIPRDLSEMLLKLGPILNDNVLEGRISSRPSAMNDTEVFSSIPVRYHLMSPP